MKYKVNLYVKSACSPPVPSASQDEVIEADVVEFKSPWVRFYRNEQPLRKLLVKAFQEDDVKNVEEIRNG